MGIFFPTINLVNITVYRPPECPINRFTLVLRKIKEWISTIETSGMPTILLNGDFNFRFLTYWNENEQLVFTESLINREQNGSNISTEKKQAFLLCNFIQEYFMEQVII